VKTHRLYRHSARVSSETGVAYSAMIGDPGPTRYSQAKDEIMAILSMFPLDQRRAILAEIAKEIVKGV
jgi:hypothetical protein